VVSHSFAFSASRRLKFSYKSILPCTAFPSTLVSMLELSPPLPLLLLLRVGGLSALSTRAVVTELHYAVGLYLLRRFVLALAGAMAIVVVFPRLSRRLPGLYRSQTTSFQILCKPSLFLLLPSYLSCSLSDVTFGFSTAPLLGSLGLERAS
jgi:hypothetical protein